MVSHEEPLRLEGVLLPLLTWPETNERRTKRPFSQTLCLGQLGFDFSPLSGSPPDDTAKLKIKGRHD